MEPSTRDYAQVATRHGVALLYLFGSRAGETAAAGSDWDFAALFDADPGAELLPRCAALQLELERCLENRVDVTALNDADPVLRFEVIAGGRPVYAHSERERVLFEARVLREYHDSAHRRRVYAEATRRYFRGPEP